MTDRKPPRRLGVAPGKARNSTSDAADGASKPTNPSNDDKKPAGIENATGARAEKTYGVVLKGGNAFVASSGVIGAATAKVDIPGGAAELRPDGTCVAMKPPKGAA
jgi:uncharacterized membrane protein